jgi:hypothetical protein
MRRSWTTHRVLDYRIDACARNSALVIKQRGGGAAEQFLRRLVAHLDEVPTDGGSGLAPLEYDPDRPSRRPRSK